jgi:hypothetical protein
MHKGVIVTVKKHIRVGDAIEKTYLVQRQTVISQVSIEG